MRVGMIVVLAVATMATRDDTSRVIRSALRFAARAAQVEPSASRATMHRHVPVATARSHCAGHAEHAHRPGTATAVTTHQAAYRRQGPAVSDSMLRALRAGGLVIVFRHALTDRSQSDARALSRTDRATQRNLNTAGIEQAKRIGELIRTLRVPADEVYASPLFRAMDTAITAFGHAEASEALWRTGTAAERTRLLSEPPAAGTNRVLVTHNFVLIAVFPGLRPSDLREGDAMVVRPLGNGTYDVFGRLTVEELARFVSDSASATRDRVAFLTPRLRRAT